MWISWHVKKTYTIVNWFAQNLFIVLSVLYCKLWQKSCQCALSCCHTVDCDICPIHRGHKGEHIVHHSVLEKLHIMKVAHFCEKFLLFFKINFEHDAIVNDVNTMTNCVSNWDHTFTPHSTLPLRVFLLLYWYSTTFPASLSVQQKRNNNYAQNTLTMFYSSKMINNKFNRLSLYTHKQIINKWYRKKWRL